MFLLHLPLDMGQDRSLAVPMAADGVSKAHKLQLHLFRSGLVKRVT